MPVDSIVTIPEAAVVREIASGGCARFKENRAKNGTHVRTVLPPSPTRFRARRPHSSRRRRRRVVTSRRAGDARKRSSRTQRVGNTSCDRVERGSCLERRYEKGAIALVVAAAKGEPN